MLCFAHDIPACAMCMVADFHDAVDELKERRRAAKLEAKATQVHERFDVGGEA